MIWRGETIAPLLISPLKVQKYIFDHSISIFRSSGYQLNRILASLEGMVSKMKGDATKGTLQLELQALIDQIRRQETVPTSGSVKSSSPSKKQSVLTKELTDEVQKLKGMFCAHALYRPFF